MFLYRFLIYFLGDFSINLRSKLKMFDKTLTYVKAMWCFNCFGFLKRRNTQKVKPAIYNSNLSQELLLDDDDDDFDDEESFCNDEVTSTTSGDDSEEQSRPKRSEDILVFRVENGMICRQFPVKETDKVFRTEVIVTKVIPIYIFLCFFIDDVVCYMSFLSEWLFL